MTDGVHHSAVVGGSNCGRVIACPPSRLSGVPVVDTGTVYTERGTVLHKAMEDYLSTGQIPDVVQTTPIIGEMREAAEAARDIWENYVFGQRVREIHIEMKLHMVPIPGAFGTADVIVEWNENVLSIVDWKFGVQTVGWEQLLFYAACALYDKQTRHLFKPDTIVELAIIQPDAIDGQAFKVKRVTVGELFDFIRKLSWAIDNGHREELLNAGDHCRWCPMKVVCPELQRIAEGAQVWEDPHGLDPDEAADALAQADVLEFLIKSIREYVHERLNSGQPVTGYKLVNKRGRRQWVDEETVVQWAAQQSLSASDIYDTQLKSPAAVEKLVNVPEHLYSTVSSGTTFARESDNRPEVLPQGKLEEVARKLITSTLI